MTADQCRKVTRIGREMLICHKPLHHEAEIRERDGVRRLVHVHEGVLAGEKREWEDEVV